MRLLHVSDTHVGFANYARVTPDGLNQREQDFFDAFERAIDVAIAQRVDVVLHSGDVFDSVRPTNRAIHHVLAQCRRLADARIPIVIISGNHEAPRLRETGAVLRLLDFMPGVHAVYKGEYEKIRIGELAVHAIPHAADNDALRNQVGLVSQDGSARYNVAMLHVGIVGVGDFRMGEFHEQTLAQNELPQRMDYVALGHYHRAVEVAPHAWYAGSTERCTFREAGEAKSVNLVDLARGSVTPIELATRPMIDLAPLRCEGMIDQHIGLALYERLAGAPARESIARIRVTGIPAHVYSSLDTRRIKELTMGALHFEVQYDIVRAQMQGVSAEGMGDLSDEFGSFLSQRALTSGDRETLLGAARTLLRDAVQQEAA